MNNENYEKVNIVSHSFEFWEWQELIKFMYNEFPEYRTTDDESFSHEAIRIMAQLKKENTELKDLITLQQKSNIKLNDDCVKLQKEIAELKAELDRVQCDECMNLQDENIKLEEEIAELKSQLASIIEDKILEVLEEHSGKDKFGKYFKIYEGVWQRFAQEILQGQGWEVVATNQPFCKNYCGDTLYEVDKNHVLDMAIRIREINKNKKKD